MAYESCSIGQREGNDCGRYPTCKKNTDPSVSAGPSGVLSLNPAPENTKVVSGSKDSGYPNMAIDPNYIFGSVQSTRSPFFSNYPQPGAGSPAVFQPLYPPLNQPPVIPQAPFNFGASPHNPFYPQHPNPNPTSTEPSLWNQFLYNKQPDKRPRNAAPRSRTTPHTLLLALEGASNVYSNGPKPSAPVASGGSNSDDDVLGSLGLNPNNPYGQRPTPAPTPVVVVVPASMVMVDTPVAVGGGGGRPSSGGSFNGAGGNIVVPTQKPAAGGGGFFGGILSGVQNAVSNAVKQQVGTYINQRLGLGPAAGTGGSAGGLGGLFDARNLIDNKRLGGLFAENNPRPAGTSSSPQGGQSYGGGGSSIGPGGYPVTVDQRTSATQYAPQYAQPGQSYGYQNAQNSYSSGGRARAATTARPAYGWNTQ
ncbi:hypothetical protein AND_006604 [Anopheles darlingi]|uniref:Uncharacterized protein n=1 Tax=Anopheles darlingi TaxID=43151 RepID=W5JEF3_ANODA|nr:hypothetical protein AND_006604 [Anopheles darlingi]